MLDECVGLHSLKNVFLAREDADNTHVLVYVIYFVSLVYECGLFKNYVLIMYVQIFVLVDQ